MLRAEEHEADTLVILDTCYASNLVERGLSGSGISRKFELLSAASIDQTTAPPGIYSFTRALIDKLRESLDKYGDRPFSTFRLTQDINLSEHRAHSPAHLWFKSVNDQSIFLAPLFNEKEKTSENALRKSKGRLTLSFDLRDSTLNRDQIKYLATKLTKAVGGRPLLGIRGINWHGITRVQHNTINPSVAVIFAVSRWKKLVHRRREERAMNSELDKGISLSEDSNRQE
ncbi:hypothetical protein HBH56_203700 [Parastagonospora nodorum]|uniref:Uncharacterized protein n=1 Tax=Phaeosphaeria nodorum (strain SN15 / ATCC MYA-4574 / FGSC 10173) TaxID=321614 RepID=A0A7U2I398_PHANO|nr:hypothetical protein HBH56_203700 [Parastagonospora nodorum]QRD01731.1 hypothetical protein JI435_439660 [Parastagonospora nodorum SN15]KAH3923975.1 hypothetical protein HBH54_202570 [Parastagonospora nodorum]KAH3959491.1 hypothetical protein HBH51_198730 [Parastagonospora nodorum]KAH4013736.1 hypothetical protein HBI09_213260 [Parastagonospora nodorum]